MGIKTVQDSSLTAVANAIRAKGGTSAQLAFPAGFVSEIGNIPSGGGGISIDWADVTEVTIGANSVTNTTGVQTYFSGYSYTFVLLGSSLTVNNQFVAAFSTQQNGSIQNIYRYRDGRVQSSTVGNAYDDKLIEGTKYYLLKRK